MHFYSRRAILAGACGGWLSNQQLLRATSQVDGQPASEEFHVELSNQFDHCRLLDVSADGSRACLQDWKVTGYPIRVIELGSWRTLYSGNFGYNPLYAVLCGWRRSAP